MILNSLIPYSLLCLLSIFNPNGSTVMKMSIDVKEITLTNSIHYIGNEFKGPYEKSSDYLEEVKTKLKSNQIRINEFEAVSIYLSDPSVDSPDQLRSFHGFVTTTKHEAKDYQTSQLKPGSYIVAKTMDMSEIWDLFGAVYQYAGQNKIQVQDFPPVMITSVEDKAPVFTLYVAKQ